eukprot:CAMPEP_0113503210 /NCGR_PEP_ID=MMETSP0014_2-20120614/34021_1 /TAXON_ID=2857 /ORGANISM="Nitzschia sp." /LENGTH=271 /DNA_ID=CAMNT_0000398159 /DNA_START=38 /DNA_END=850 /DNA_ORIENTATION=- /assembly_acc=CAM_ASM_000159
MIRNTAFISAICCSVVLTSSSSSGGGVHAWSTSMTPMTPTSKTRPSSSHRSIHPYSATRRMSSMDHTETKAERSRPESSSSSSMLPSMVVAGAIWMSVVSGITASADVANAYYASDYASETVQTTVKDLKAAAGNVDETFKVYENVAGIITEGKGVGGMVNYQGIQLERGYVADEDTQVYNPGLSLLTESEKERLVDAVIDARKVGLTNGQWSENNEFAFQFLREKLDPYHMQELSGFLKFAPFYAAILYVGVLGVQQFARGAFQVAYLVG